MKYYYKIAGRNVLLDSEYLLQIDRNSSLFLDSFPEEQNDIFCHISGKEYWEETDGEIVLETEERKIYYKNLEMVLEILNRKNRIPLFHSVCPISKGKGIELWSRKSEYPYIAHMEHIWAAIDLPYQLLKHDLLTIHCATMQVNGKGILFLAPSGTGKSTQAELWHRSRGAELLNGDKTVLSAEKNTVYAYGLPFCGTSGICTNFKVPVQALVLLRQSKANEIEKLNGIQALRAVLENCFGHRKIPGCMEKIINVLGKVLNEVDVYQLNCTPDERAVQILEKELMEEI